MMMNVRLALLSFASMRLPQAYGKSNSGDALILGIVDTYFAFTQKAPFGGGPAFCAKQLTLPGGPAGGVTPGSLRSRPRDAPHAKRLRR